MNEHKTCKPLYHSHVATSSLYCIHKTLLRLPWLFGVTRPPRWFWHEVSHVIASKYLQLWWSEFSSKLGIYTGPAVVSGWPIVNWDLVLAADSVCTQPLLPWDALRRKNRIQKGATQKWAFQELQAEAWTLLITDSGGPEHLFCWAVLVKWVTKGSKPLWQASH